MSIKKAALKLAAAAAVAGATALSTADQAAARDIEYGSA